MAIFECPDSIGAPARIAQEIIQEAAGYLSEDNPHLGSWVAFDITGRLVGVVVYNPRNEDDLTHIRSLGVVKDRRHEGVGITLKQVAIASGALAGARGYFSEVHQKNWKMRLLNAKLGINYRREPSGGKYLVYSNAIEIQAPDEA